VSPAVVAAELGFADQAHFTRLFKTRYGMPPGRYVRASLGPGSPAAVAPTGASP
jgi:AraC-like DNA-binding protein